MKGKTNVSELYWLLPVIEVDHEHSQMTLLKTDDSHVSDRMPDWLKMNISTHWDFVYW